MCDICTTAMGKLERAVEEIENAHPGTEVDGEAVTRSHHVMVGLTVLGTKYALRDAQEAHYMKQDGLTGEQARERFNSELALYRENKKLAQVLGASFSNKIIEA